MPNSASPTRSASCKQTTTVFTSGNSQAVRLPKAFRFNSKTVEIERCGNEVVLRERSESLGQRLANAMGDLPPLSPKDAATLDEVLSLARDDRPPQERDWGALLGTGDDAKASSSRTAATRRSKRP